MEKLTW